MYITFNKKWQEEHFKDLKLSDGLKPHVEANLRYGASEIQIDFAEFTREDLDTIYAKAKEIKDRSIMMQISAYTNVLDNPKQAKIANIKVFAAVLRDWVQKDAINHWIFITKKDSGVTLPFFVYAIKYVEPRSSEETPYVELQLKANSINHFSRNSYSFDSGDVVGKTIDQVMSALGIEHETEELIASYMEYENIFVKERKQFNKQYRVDGFAYCDRWHSTELAVRAINDEEINERKYTLKTTSSYWKEFEDGADKVYPIPVHPFLYLYSLDTYENFYMHVSSVKDYVYDDSLRDKLILPETHSDLLDILTEDLSVLSGDIIEGKSSGTTILCKGQPGVGKTLTAEAYSEITHRPLYKINSGQLGTSPNAVEENLEKVLKRAERWGAVMLIDEADTYIRKRGDDICQNAIVAAFLRTLEYFNGLLFMTTNRMDDVDDAIESRCIAIIEYHIPTKENSKKIWRVLADQFNLNVSDDLISELVDVFPTVSGRDIKELLRLTGRYAKAKNLELTVKAFISCAQFRGVEINAKG